MKLKTISRVNTKLDNNEIIVYIEGNNPSQLERFKDYINLYNQKLTLAMDGKICSISIISSAFILKTDILIVLLKMEIIRLIQVYISCKL